MTQPSGDQFEITAGGYRAVITEGGAALRVLEHEGRPVVDGFAEDSMSSRGRGQLLMPWPNRLRDGRYEFAGRDHQLALTEPARHNASHGLVRWAPWTLEEHTSNSVSLVHRLMAQTGYPWSVDLHVLYDLSAEGLHVTQTATNLSAEDAPFAAGAHPYLTLGIDLVHLELTVPARRHLTVDPERRLPLELTDIIGTDVDFTVPRVVGSTELDHTYGDLQREEGRTTVSLRDPASGREVTLWVDERHRWIQVFTPPASEGRRSIAVEPMTAPPDAFNSGTDLVVLGPTGTPGDEISASWGIRVVS